MYGNVLVAEKVTLEFTNSEKSALMSTTGNGNEKQEKQEMHAVNMETDSKAALRESVAKKRAAKAPKTVAEGLKAAGLDVTERKILVIFPEDLDIVLDEAHPLYDPRVHLPIDEDFLEDIRTHGVMNPVEVRKNGLDDNGKPLLQIVVGRRRTTHARELNRRLVAEGGSPLKIPVIVVSGSDQDMLLRAISENAHRKDEGVYSRAFKARSAIQCGATKDAVRKALKCAPNTLDDLLDFLNLTPEVQAEFEKGTFPLGTIPTFAKIPREKQPAKLERLLKTGAKKRHEVKAALEADSKGETYKRPDMKKCLTRGQMEAWAAEMNMSQDADCKTAMAVLSFVLGYRTALRQFPAIEAAAEAVEIEVVPVEAE